MKRIISVLLVILLILPFFGCLRQEEFEFMQPSENITNIELLKIYYTEFPPPSYSCSFEELYQITVLCAIEEDRWPDFLTDLENVPQKRGYGDPIDSVTGDSFRITYRDGSCEIFSDTSIFRMYSSGESEYLWFNCDDDVLDQMIIDYAVRLIIDSYKQKN